MDREKAFEAQFSKLHPSLPLNTRIGIIGAGPSGLSAAYALSKLGYTNVTVLEKQQAVGGMCESVEIQGRIYDLGGQVLAANSAPTIFHLAKETGCELEEMDSHKLALIDTAGKYQDISVAEDYKSIISITLELQDKAKSSGYIGVHAVSESASDLTSAYLESHGLTSVPKSVAYGYTASGYGFMQDMPYAYVHEFIRTSMAGKIRRFKGGYGGLWKKISESLPIKVLCNTEIVAVRRNSISVNLEIMDRDRNLSSLQFDKVIVSGSFHLKNARTYRSSNPRLAEEAEIMDMGDLEKELFSKVCTIDYYTTALQIKGFDHLPLGFFYFGEHMDNPETIGYPVAMQRFYLDTDIFLFWSYGNFADIIGPNITELAIKTVESMGGEVEKVILQRRFKYFPHVCSKDMEDGFYKKLELELQGSQNTYYVGGLMAFELTERNSSYSMALVCKHFADNNPSPMFPYVKPMFHLQSMRKREIKQLSELPGVEFPNLSSVDGYLRHWGSHQVTQDKVLYTWLNEEGKVLCQRTYRELHVNASCIAQKLLSNKKPLIKPRDRVLLIYIPGLEFIDAFFGCLRANIIPVPVLPPDPMQRGGQLLLKIEHIVQSSGAVAILSTIGYHSAVRVAKVKNMISLTRDNGKSPALWPKLPWIHTDSWVKNSAKLDPEFMPNQHEPHPDDISFLQFTSGSTGDAKGVMITHGGLIHNVKLMRKRYKSTSKTVLVSWLPQYHDMGLIGGLFTALVSGGTAVLFSPMTFIKNPLLWLQTMSKYEATHSAGPNFAFELIARRLESNKDKIHKYDLSSMVFLMSAAEPIRITTVKRFIELTSPFGLSEDVMAPGYGLAENCVFVSCAYGEGKPIFIDWQTRVCCGYVEPNNADVDIRIVNPETGKELEEDGKEGEIWISSPSAGIGYWGKEELSRVTFRNKLQNHPTRIYTRTGDLGRIIDKKLFITGRIKDIFIAAGRNIYPADVEKTVESSSDLLRPGCCAVIGVPEEILMEKGIPIPNSSDEVGVVIIAEVKDTKFVDKDIIEQIQNCVAEEHGVGVASVKLIKPRTISKTTSGKIKRFDCLKQFIDGTLNVVPEATKAKRTFQRSFTTGTCREGNTPRPHLMNFSRDSFQASPRISNKDIVEFLKVLVSELTNIPTNKISATESLLTYGIDSIRVVRAAQKLSNFLGVAVGAVDILSASCIADLASISENLLIKSHPQSTNDPTSNLVLEPTSTWVEMEKISKTRQCIIWFFQLLALIFVATMLVFPAYLSISTFICSISILHKFTYQIPHMNYVLCLTFAPLAWILCIASSCICIAFFGNLFLQPNYALTPEVSIWSIDFVKWWALYKAQEVSSKVLAVHLRGTIFLKFWFQVFGSRIGSSVILDTIDITDPSLVSIGDGSVIAEGALIQSHDVKNGVLRFLPIKIGQKSSIGPYAFIQKGATLGDEVDIPALQKIEGSKFLLKSFDTNNPSKCDKPGGMLGAKQGFEAIYHFLGIYLVGFLGSLSAATFYFFYIWLSQSSPSFQHLSFLCIVGAFHWIPFSIIAYATMFSEVPPNAVSFAISFSSIYLVHGIILCTLTCILKNFLTTNPEMKQNPLKIWLCHRITIACHLRFSKLLSGTEALSIYLRHLGAVIGKHCSIRAINPISDPELISIGTGVHLGDFSRIISGFYSTNGLNRGKIEVRDNAVIGSQSVVLPGSVIQEDVILGALAIAPMNSELKKGGVYVGSQTPIMIKNTLHVLDERIEAMDMKYKKIVGNLAANLSAATLKSKARYFHRIGVTGKGHLKIFDEIKGLPDHEIFSFGKTYPIFIRHSNSLSADDDARIDARGAALKIFSDDISNSNSSLIDLTLKTGDAFYARTMADFASWLVCGLAAREEHVKQVPHIRDAVWNSFRVTDSFTELHYYSNFCRLLRFKNGQEMYVKFKLRPYDPNISEDSGKVEPIGILPPETGAIPRAEDDKRPLLFLADDFQNRVNSSNGVRYVFQIQIRSIPDDEVDREIALDSTKPWDQTQFPYLDIGEIIIDEILPKEQSDRLEMNPFRRCHEVDVISATSSSQSASIDHGRSLVYEICQYLRNGTPLPETWRSFLEQSDFKVDLSGCPMAAALERNNREKVELDRTWLQSFWVTFFQPFLQTALPYFIIGFTIFFPLSYVLPLKEDKKLPLNWYWLLPLLWVFSGITAAFSCVLAKWVLVKKKKKEGESSKIWSIEIFMDTIWQAIKLLVGDYFMELTSGSFIFVLWMKLMGSDVDLDRGVYVDTMGALLNPEMVKIEGGGSVGREALLFGHIYEGGGEVQFGKIEIGEGAFVGSRAIAMPGVKLESDACLSSLSLAMKEEIIRAC